MSGDLSLDEIRFILEEHGYNYIQAIGEGGFGEVLLVHSHKYHSHFCCKVRPLKRVKKRSSKNEISDHSNRPAASNSALSKKDSNLPSNSDGNDHPEISDQNANLFGDQIFNKIDDEIAINIKLEHPNIISIFDHFTVRDTVFIIMEYCPNGSLDEYIKSYGKICPPMLYSLCYQIASSVKKCHNYLVAHRDIKPANILLDLRCRPKLADFGISCDLSKESNEEENNQIQPRNVSQNQSNGYMVNSNSSKVNLNQIPSMNSLRTFKLNDGEKLENDLVLNENQNMLENSNILCSSSDSQAKNKVPTTNDRKYTIKRHNGSPPYMAPEIFDQDSEYDPFKADIWALGVTFYQMVMGKLPWQTSNLKEMKKSIKMGFFEFEVNEKNGQQICPVEFQRLIKKMCVPKVSSRLTIDQILADPLFAPFSSPASNSSSIASGVSRSLSGLKSHLSQLGNLSQLNSNCSLASPHPENKQFGIATSTSMFQKLSSGNGLLLNMREKNSESGTADRDKNQCLTLSNSFNPALKKFEKVRRQASLMRSDFARIRALNQLTNFSYNIQKPNVVSSLDKSQLSALPSIKKPA